MPMLHFARTAIAAAALCSIPGFADAQVPSTVNLLERYARGDYGALTLPRMATDLERLRQGLTHDAEAWIRAGRSTEIRRRQLVAATIALELAGAGLDLDWGQSKQLIEWGSSVLRKSAPDDAERLWHLAALSLMQGASDYELLASQQKAAWTRFDSEPRFLLAVVVTMESDTWPEPDRGEPWDSNDAALEDAFRSNAARRAAAQPALRDLNGKAYEYARRTRMRSAIDLLEQLSNEDSIRAEALLRLGYLHLRLHHSEIAIEQFEDVLTLTDDPFLLYLAHFLSGQAHEQDADRANAIASYRAALALQPRARSAAFALASLLFVDDGRDEARRLVETVVTAPTAEDPWRAYGSGDFRFLNDRLNALRQVLR